MKITHSETENFNAKRRSEQQEAYDFISQRLNKQQIDAAAVVEKLQALQVAIPSWALGAGGTRFGRFSVGGEPRSLEEKVDDVGLIHALTQTAGAISLHIPWDIPTDPAAIKERADSLNIRFDAVNSNTFQDQPEAASSYRFGSLSANQSANREQAVAHNIEVIRYGEMLGSKALTIWLADGANFPGQRNFRQALELTQDALQKVYAQLPDDWRMLVEYKPYEPNFYATVIPDWGTSLMLAEGCGKQAHTLVDLGHHLPNTNIEQIVATLLMKGRLGGFHFNDSKYGDDDLTCGSIKPYQLFLIFNELVYGIQNDTGNPPIAWMIDASHNIKDPLEDLMQSLEAILIAYAQALLVDQEALKEAQQANDVTWCQELMQRAYRTDVRPLVAQARLNAGGAIDPIGLYRHLDVRNQLIKSRGKKSTATGL
ncbi:MAG: sugar isomerase [Tunicatimonas sp.]